MLHPGSLMNHRLKVGVFSLALGIALAAPSLPAFAQTSGDVQTSRTTTEATRDANRDERPGMISKMATGAASGYVYNTFFNRENLDRGLGILAAILIAALVLGYWAYQSARKELRGYAATSRRMWGGFRGRMSRPGFPAAPGSRNAKSASSATDDVAGSVSSGVHHYDESDLNRDEERRTG